MKMSDLIAGFIGDMLLSGGGVAELSRKELADKFSCVPSQINYVLETRFSSDHGYIVESRSGGGGYIRVMQIIDDRQAVVLSVVQSIGEALSFRHTVSLVQYLVNNDVLTGQEGNIILGMCSDQALSMIEEQDRDRIRSFLVKGGLTALVAE